jgi:hypothetical protein
LLFGSVVQHVIAGCSFRALGRGIPLEKYYFLASRHGLPSLSISLAIESSLAYIAERDAVSRSNHALQPTVDRHGNFYMKTSTLKLGAELALASGG